MDKSIRKLRQRIFRATREQKWNTVRSLMKLMLRSYFNLLLSVRKVTQKNQGKKTAGVDGEVALSPQARMKIVQSMGKYSFWKARPTRRIHIPKAGKPNQSRPLSIPTLRNRIAQAIVKNALEPSWEARFESNSYGFRPGRSLHDAVERCWNYLKRRSRRPWILDTDLKSAFDKISHEHILDAIGPVPGRELIRAWLKAGYVEAENFHETDSGVPQGGIISPCLLNVALCGLQHHLGPPYGCVIYADDLIVCAETRGQIEAAQSTIEEWLKPRGLTLHPEKTRIVHVNDGFNFLSFNIRQYKGKCLIKPQKDKVLAFLADLRFWLNKHKQVKADVVIKHFNKILPGWSTHYSHAVSKQVFFYVASEIWKMLWRWCLRRHPNKGKHWIAKKYFGWHDNSSWTFQAHDGKKTIYLFDVASVKIVRHVPVRGDASPDDPALNDYWRKRKNKRRVRTHKRQVTKVRHFAELDARAE
jgi:RNA-directed DNA polymerase